MGGLFIVFLFSFFSRFSVCLFVYLLTSISHVIGWTRKPWSYGSDWKARSNGTCSRKGVIPYRH